MKRVLLFLLVYAPASWPQTNGRTARTTGSCSPAVTGNNNTFTMTCEGVPKDKAEEMVRLMNVILEKQLDPKRVYSQLEGISNQVNDIGATLDPVGHAPPAVAALLNKSMQMETACGEFASNWGIGYINKVNASNREQSAERERRSRETGQRFSQQSAATVEPGYKPLLDAIDQKYSAEYKATLASKVTALQHKLLDVLANANAPAASTPAKPGLHHTVDYEAVSTATELSNVQAGLQSLIGTYSIWVLRGKGTNDTVVKETQDLVLACTKLIRQWSDESNQTRSEYQKSHPVAPLTIPQNLLKAANPMAISDSNDQERAAEYRKTLGPELSEWRTQIVPQLPGISHVANYNEVSTALDLRAVCADAMNLTNEYREKVVRDLRSKNQSK